MTEEEEEESLVHRIRNRTGTGNFFRPSFPQLLTATLSLSPLMSEFICIASCVPGSPSLHVSYSPEKAVNLPSSIYTWMQLNQQLSQSFVLHSRLRHSSSSQKSIRYTKCVCLLWFREKWKTGAVGSINLSSQEQLNQQVRCMQNKTFLQ